MSNLSQPIAQLSRARSKLLEQSFKEGAMLHQTETQSSDTRSGSSIAPPALEANSPSTQIQLEMRRFNDEANEQLNSTMFGYSVFFLNDSYEPDHNPDAHSYEFVNHSVDS